MKKEFKIVNKDLHVSIKNEDVVILPVDGKRKEVGSFTQQTLQIIKEDSIKTLKNFISEEHKKIKKQLSELKKQLEPIKDLQDLDETIVKHAKLAIQKGTKAFKIQMGKLNQRIIDTERKKALIAQIEYVEKQYKDVSDDLNALNKIVK